MITKFTITDEFIDQINHLVDLSDFTCLDRAEFKSEWSKVMLYPTNDVYLTPRQFEALKRYITAIEEDYFICFEMESISNVASAEKLSTYRTGYKIDKDATYEQYQDLYICENGILVSKKFDWIIITEELSDGGFGIFSANKNFTAIFQNFYDNSKDSEKLPNEETISAMEEVKQMEAHPENYTGYKDIKSLRQALDKVESHRD